jgi:hypothetical protein
MNGQVQDNQRVQPENNNRERNFIGKLRDIFASEKTPYIITIFFAALAWTIIRTVDELTGLPIIEYNTSTNEVQFSRNYNSQSAGVRLRNITRNVTFGCLIFSVQAFSQDNRYLFIKSTDKRYILRGTS